MHRATFQPLRARRRLTSRPLLPALRRGEKPIVPAASAATRRTLGTIGALWLAFAGGGKVG